MFEVVESQDKLVFKLYVWKIERTWIFNFIKQIAVGTILLMQIAQRQQTISGILFNHAKLIYLLILYSLMDKYLNIVM